MAIGARTAGEAAVGRKVFLQLVPVVVMHNIIQFLTHEVILEIKGKIRVSWLQGRSISRAPPQGMQVMVISVGTLGCGTAGGDLFHNTLILQSHSLGLTF